MEQNFFDRLDKFMEISNLNDNKITVSAALSIGILGKARKKAGGLSVENIAKILYAYPNLNADWLLTGRGGMLRVPVEPIEQPAAAELAKRDEEIRWLKKQLETVNDTNKMLAEQAKYSNKKSLV